MISRPWLLNILQQASYKAKYHICFTIYDHGYNFEIYDPQFFVLLSHSPNPNSEDDIIQCLINFQKQIDSFVPEIPSKHVVHIQRTRYIIKKLGRIEADNPKLGVICRIKETGDFEFCYRYNEGGALQEGGSINEEVIIHGDGEKLQYLEMTAEILYNKLRP